VRLTSVMTRMSWSELIVENCARYEFKLSERPFFIVQPMKTLMSVDARTSTLPEEKGG
jgi:hypothetical protein